MKRMISMMVLFCVASPLLADDQKSESPKSEMERVYGQSKESKKRLGLFLTAIENEDVPLSKVNILFNDLMAGLYIVVEPTGWLSRFQSVCLIEKNERFKAVSDDLRMWLNTYNNKVELTAFGITKSIAQWMSMIDAAEKPKKTA